MPQSHMLTHQWLWKLHNILEHFAVFCILLKFDPKFNCVIEKKYIHLYSKIFKIKVKEAVSYNDLGIMVFFPCKIVL